MHFFFSVQDFDMDAFGLKMFHGFSSSLCFNIILYSLGIST